MRGMSQSSLDNTGSFASTYDNMAGQLRINQEYQSYADTMLPACRLLRSGIICVAPCSFPCRPVSMGLKNTGKQKTPRSQKIERQIHGIG